MVEPGEGLYDWESEMATLEDELRESPAETLPELDRLLTRMLEEAGYELADPVVREGDEREVVAEYLAAHEIVEALERGADDISAGDIGAAINGYRTLFDFLVAERGSTDADFGALDEA
jgi:hypothetical protein